MFQKIKKNNNKQCKTIPTILDTEMEINKKASAIMKKTCVGKYYYRFSQHYYRQLTAKKQFLKSLY